MKIGLLPNITNIINEQSSPQEATHWHNFLQTIHSAIEKGQPVGNAVPIIAAQGIVLEQSIRSSIVRIISATSGNCTITANPQIIAGFDGQELTLEGSDNTRTVTLSNGNGLQLLGGATITLKNGDIIKLHYNAVRTIWIENYRSINS